MDPRDQTFMTIHNLTADANILFASDSIYDILGYQPDEVRGKSAFEYFHPDEVPFARSIHSRGVLLDKAAVLHYARILAKSGQWISCECCFTVVHNVLVASTSIYYKGERSERRARDAPHIRRIFSSSPRDPRYQMLEHLSPKFKMPPMEREPRAALILNRFTRNLSIMYATDAVTQILGVRPDELLDKPFYECIQPNCLDEAERCLESAKANESIAYLRFWYKDPRVDPNDPPEEDDDADAMDDDDDDESSAGESEVDVKDPNVKREESSDMDVDEEDGNVQNRQSEQVVPQDEPGASGPGRPRPRGIQTFELEAVVSCTSDGLVVVLRRARPPIPDPQPPVIPSPFHYENGLFAAPWGSQPIEPYIPPNLLYTFRPPLLPQYMPLRECVKAAGGPPFDQLMRSIRDVAVFAWAVTGINPSLANYMHGRPRISGDGVDGLPAWKADYCPSSYPPPEDLSSPTRDDHDVPKDSTPGPFFSRPSSGGHAPVHGFRARHGSLDENMYDPGGGGGCGGCCRREAGYPPSACCDGCASSMSWYAYRNCTRSTRCGLDRPCAADDEACGCHHQHCGYQHHHHHHCAGACAPRRCYHHHGHQHCSSSSSSGNMDEHHHRRPPLRPAFSYDALYDHARLQQQQQTSSSYHPRDEPTRQRPRDVTEYSPHEGWGVGGSAEASTSTAAGSSSCLTSASSSSSAWRGCCNHSNLGGSSSCAGSSTASGAATATATATLSRGGSLDGPPTGAGGGCGSGVAGVGGLGVGSNTGEGMVAAEPTAAAAAAASSATGSWGGRGRYYWE